jgi:hypothetical protein
MWNMAKRAATRKTRRMHRKPDMRGENLYELFLGYPFDQLLNRRCPYGVLKRYQERREQWKKGDEKRGHGRPGIVLPDGTSPGSGNIVICGPPGSGKSTLALQFAVACANRPINNAISAYFSLEVTASDVFSKAEPFKWQKYLREIQHLHSADEFATVESLADTLMYVLTQPEDCPFRPQGKPSGSQCEQHHRLSNEEAARYLLKDAKGQVLLAALSPRPLVGDEVKTAVFSARYKQIERFLSAASCLRQRCARKKAGANFRWVLPMVVVDSLNMLAMRPLLRDELLMLFSLFRQHETVGVFVVESTLDTPFDSTLADVVISLDMPKDNGYVVRHIKIDKSRYQDQVYGWHPFRTVALEDPDYRTPPISDKSNPPGGDQPRHGIVVFPSLHYVVLESGEGRSDKRKRRPAKESTTWKEPGKHFGISAFDRVLPRDLQEGSVIVIEGPRGTLKTNLAMTFLAQGLVEEKSGLLIRLHDSPLLNPHDKESWPPLSEDIEQKNVKLPFWKRLKPLEGEEAKRWQYLVDKKKGIISGWTLTDTKFNTRLFEVDFKSGALLPEELMQVVWDIIFRCEEDEKIKRVVLDDVSEIGAAYPFLRKSSTSGDFFLPAMAHVMRNHHIDFVVTGTTGALSEGDEAVGRIRAAADTVVSCRYLDVFGKRHVIVQGEGLTAQAKSPPPESGTSAPPVIQNVTVGKEESQEKVKEGTQEERQAFRVDAKYLEGLVGFESGNVHRPGVFLHLFEQPGEIYKRYNQETELMLRAAFADEAAGGFVRSIGSQRELPATDKRPSAPAVTVLPFGSEESMAIHDSLRVFREDEPINETVVCTVDEFSSSRSGPEGNLEKRFVELDPSEFQDSDSGSTFKRVRPYYRNVLLLVYRDKRVSLDGKNWMQMCKEIKEVEYTKALLGKGKSPKEYSDEVPEIGRRFWFDLSAPETLSCALIDALKTGARIEHEKLSKDHEGSREDSAFEKVLQRMRRPTGLMLKELLALHDLFHITGWSDQKNEQKRAPYRSLLPDDAAVYLCWYAQLRELIEHRPGLARQLKVCALPGGGFRGDWYIGTVQGSVSPALGQRIIEILCRKEEQYKRFTRGVGLPVHRDFGNTKFNAWPCARVKLRTVLNIYEHADSRSKTADYGKIRLRLYNIARQLTPLVGRKVNEAGIRRIVFDRLPQQVEMLKS